MSQFLYGFLAALACVAMIVFFSLARIPYCPTEDSFDCFWDASKLGNGHGRNFINFTIYLNEV